MIGSNLVKKLVSLGHRVKVVDNLWRGKIEYLNDEKGIPVINLNEDFFDYNLAIPGICNKLIQESDYVFHLADIVAGINYVFAHQGDIFRQNILINSNVITSVRQSKTKGFIYVGTACSFPESLQSSLDVRPLKEEDLYPAEPESAYGWSKLMGMYETSLMEMETDVPTSTLIMHNVYGSPCDFEEERSQVIPALIRKAIRYPEEDFIVWGSGEQGRAFIHVDDAVNALVLTLDRGLNKGHIQIGPSECISIRQVAQIIIKSSGKDIKIKYDISQPEGDKARCADYSKAASVLGWEPKVSIEDGIEELYQWIDRRI